jgi:hypothetical protein
MKKFFLPILTAFAASALWATASAASASGGAQAAASSYVDEVNTVTAEEKAYFTAVQSAVVKGDKQWLADQVRPGLTAVSIRGKDVTLGSKKEFLDNYQDIVTPALRAEIGKLKTSDLAKSWKGVSADYLLSFAQMADYDAKTQKKTSPMRYRLLGLGGVPSINTK